MSEIISATDGLHLDLPGADLLNFGAGDDLGMDVGGADSAAATDDAPASRAALVRTLGHDGDGPWAARIASADDAAGTVRSDYARVSIDTLAQDAQNATIDLASSAASVDATDVVAVSRADLINERGAAAGGLIHDLSPSATVHGGYDDDVLDGTAGDDVITDFGGSNTIHGLGGNDSISLEDYSYDGTPYEGRVTTNLIDAGTGDDTVKVQGYGTGTLTVDLGTGNDVLSLNVINALSTLTLGAGQDQVIFGETMGFHAQSNAVTVVVTDFAAGNGGDVLDLTDLLTGYFTNSPLPPGNLFASGYLSLVQDGADTIVRLDRDGNGPGHGDSYFRDIIRLQNVTASQLTAFNLGGFAPDGSPPVPPTVNGTAGTM